MKKREQGKLLFYGIKADGANVQVMASLSDYEGGEEAFWKVGGEGRHGGMRKSKGGEREDQGREGEGGREGG